MKWVPVVVCLAALATACTDEHEVLMKDLNHDSPVIRAGAVRSLAKLGDDEAYMLVSRSLDDRSAIVRIAAVGALDGFKGRDTMAPLIRASRDRDPEVREAAVGALARRPSEQSQKALVRVLLDGEPAARVRKLVYASLEKMGLSGERLSGEMAESQLSLIRESMAKGSPAERRLAVLRAGRSIHPGGIDVVLEGLADRDQDVVLTALRMLDGRGGQQALQKIQLLLADQVEAIRAGAVRALPAYGQAGLSLLVAGLRDPAPAIRLQVLDAYAKEDAQPPAGLVCPLLSDDDARVAISAAGLLRGKDANCALDGLAAALASDDPAAREKALGVLSALGGERAQEVLRQACKRHPGADALPFSAALARAGDRSPATRSQLRSALDGALNEAETLAESWVGGKLAPPAGDGTPAPGQDRGESLDGGDKDAGDGGAAADEGEKEEQDRSRLSDEELNALYKKYGLGPADADSPRGVSDILAGFDDADQGQDAGTLLFDPVSGPLIDRIRMGLDGLLAIDPQGASAQVARALSIEDAPAMARVAAVLNSHGVAVVPTDAQFDRLGQALRDVPGGQAAPLVDLLVRTSDDRAVRQLTAALPGADWEKKMAIATGLGRLGKKQAVGALTSMLKGYSSIPAARALAELGQPEAIGPLMQVLETAGPAEEMEILMALARLGCRDIEPRLLAKLDSAEPDVRRSAVIILGVLGGAKEMDALKGLRYDLDRLVRAEVNRVLQNTKTGDGSDVWPKARDQGRSGKPAQER